MKVRVYGDEAYPVYRILPDDDEPCGGELIELTDEEYATYLRVTAEYDKIQGLLWDRESEAYDARTKKEKP